MFKVKTYTVFFTLLLTTSLSYGQCASFNAVAFADDVVCNGENDGKITIQVRNTTFFPPYEYSIGSGFQSGSASGRTFIDLSPGTYRVEVRNNQGIVCDLGDFVVNEPPPITVMIDVTQPLCGNNGEVCSIATGGNIEPDPVTGEYDPELYFQIWNIIGPPPQSQTSVATTRCIRNIGGGNYKVTVSDNRGCTAEEMPDVDIVAQDTFRVSTDDHEVSVNYGDEIELRTYVDFDTDFQNPLTIQWNPLENIDNPNDTVTTVRPCRTTEYIVSVKSNDTDLECFDTTGINVVVNGQFEPWAPNAFTPDGQGPAENETFKIYGRGLFSVELAIYDRSGALMYETTDKDEGWDGTINGNKEASSDTYLYVAKAISICGEVKAVRGDFTLLR